MNKEQIIRITKPLSPSPCRCVLRVKKLLIMLLIFISTFKLSAQTAAEMDSLLETETVTIAAAARFVLGAAELLRPELSGAEAERAAFELAVSNGWITQEADELASLKDISFLIINAFEIKGGVFYRFFRNPRYAFREMVYQNHIQGRAYPDMLVSGPRLLQIIERAGSTE